MNSSLDHLRPDEQKAIRAFLSRLWSQFPRRILQTTLFGSKSRRDSQPESDIDILLIVDDEDWRFSHAISDVAADVSLEYNLLIDPRVIGRERWERMARENLSLYQNIAREGIPLTPEPA